MRSHVSLSVAWEQFGLNWFQFSAKLLQSWFKHTPYVGDKFSQLSGHARLSHVPFVLHAELLWGLKLLTLEWDSIGLTIFSFGCVLFDSPFFNSSKKVGSCMVHVTEPNGLSTEVNTSGSGEISGGRKYGQSPIGIQSSFSSSIRDVYINC